jgi:transcriptional regulator with XRE-family HTH domain
MVDIIALPDDSIGRRLKVLMAQQNMGPGELARAAGVNATGLAHWLHDRRRPDRHNLVKLASALGCEPGDIDPRAPAQAPAPMREPAPLRLILRAFLMDHMGDLITEADKMGYEITIRRR